MDMNFVFTGGEYGSKLARDGGVLVCGDVGCAGLFAGKPAPTGETRSHQEPGRLLGRLVPDVDLGAPLTTLAERRHCAVGNPARMPG